MSRAKIVVHNDGTFYGVRFDCPGCALTRDHGSKMVVLPVDWTPAGYERSPAITAKPWGFNGDLESPTFTPSVLSQWNEYMGEGVPAKHHVCHSFIRSGKIQFLDDCTHALAGQTVDLPELDAEDAA
jgi:hypothetical protein